MSHSHHRLSYFQYLYTNMLCELVGYYCKSAYKLQTHLTTFHFVTNKVESNCIVLTFLNKHWILCQFDRRLVVDQKESPTLITSHLLLQHPEIQTFVHCILDDHIYGFCARTGSQPSMGQPSLVLDLVSPIVLPGSSEGDSSPHIA